MKTVMWTTARGETIPLHDMDTSHIENSMRKIERSNFRWRGSYWRHLKCELEIRNLGLTSKRMHGGD